MAVAVSVRLVVAAVLAFAALDFGKRAAEYPAGQTGILQEFAVLQMRSLAVECRRIAAVTVVRAADWNLDSDTAAGDSDSDTAAAAIAGR